MKRVFGLALALVTLVACAFWPFRQQQPQETIIPLWTPIPYNPDTGIPPTVTPTPTYMLPTPSPIALATATAPPPPTATPAAALPTVVAEGGFTPVVPIRPGPLVQVPHLASPPTIDGDLREWQGIPAVAIQYATYGVSLYAGPQDISGLLYMGWDAQYLYLAFQVVDDVFVQTATGRYLYRGDSAEILVDVDLFGDRYTRFLSADDYQLGFSPGSPPGNHPEVWRWYPRHLEGVPQGVLIAARPLGQGYTLEVAVPWSAIGITVASPGLRMGFVAALSDNDLPGTQVQQTLVSNDPYRRLTDPTTWGEMVLLP